MMYTYEPADSNISSEIFEKYYMRHNTVVKPPSLLIEHCFLFLNTDLDCDNKLLKKHIFLNIY